MKRYSVLIIDDDETTHELLGEYMMLAGYTPLRATNALEGLTIMEERVPDLVLLDIQMPEMDGFQAMELIRKSEGLKDLPVIFLTGLDRPNLKVKALEMGAEDYVVKPFNKAELLARVKAALRRCARYRRLEGAMEGRLSDVTLPELLQTLEIGRKDAHVKLDDIEGELFLEGGMFINARQGSFKGEQALYRLMFLEDGRFSVRFTGIPDDVRQPPVAVQSALMEAATYIDEVRLILSGVSPGNPMVEIVPEEAEASGLINYVKLSPVTLFGLVTLIMGDLKDNAELLRAAYRSGGLKLDA